MVAGDPVGRRIDDERGVAVVRSVLPYTLHLVLTREVDDGVAGRLRVGIDGDLEGWASFARRGRPGHGGVLSAGGRVRRAYLRRAAPFAGPPAAVQPPDG